MAHAAGDIPTTALPARVRMNPRSALLGLLVVLAANLRFLEGSSAALDPMLSMDPFYIDLARRPLSSILGGDPSWGPLYAVWLKPFVMVLGDPLQVYVANAVALSLALSLAIYAHLLTLTRQAALATAGALFFVVSDFNLPLFSKVSAFALLVTLSGLSLAQLVPGGPRRLAAASLSVLIAAWARPELLPAGLGLALASAGIAWRRGEPLPKRLVVCVGLTGLFLLAGRSGGDSDDRLWLAFREHFLWNWSRWHGEWRYLATVWREEFGDAHSVLGAIRANPAAAFHHFADNLAGVIRFFAASTCGHFPLLAPATRPGLVQLETIAMNLLLAAAVVSAFADQSHRRQLLERHGSLLAAYAMIALFSLVAAVVVFPRPHYLAIPSVLLWLLALLVVSQRTQMMAVPAWTGVVAALTAFAVIPRPFVLPSAHEVAGSPYVGRFSTARPVHDTVELVRSLGLPHPVRVLTLNDGIGEMLGDGFEEIKIWRRGDQPLADYIRDNQVAVVITMEAGRESFLIDDPHWRRLLTNPESTGFVRRAVPGNPNVGVYVRRELAP